MMKVITYDDQLLKEKSENVDNINKEVKDLIKKMFKTMYFSNGIGLAAVQVGVLKRVFVVDVPDYGKYEMINPVITERSDDISVYEEGCLSLPGIAHEVERPNSITVEYQDIDGKKQNLKASGLLATCIQHEYDHLEGILFIDRLSPEDKLKMLKNYNKLHIV
jgi:peptide deformylase